MYKPYLDFYIENQVSPVPNQINLQRYLEIRKNLYRSLGITPSSLNNKTILEFGPGNGANSLCTFCFKPKKYVLVDGNPTAISNCHSNFRKHFPSLNNYEIIKDTVEHFSYDELFDLVICEGLIPHQHDPQSMFKKIASHVRPGGLILISCHDFISNISEILRGFLGYLLIKEGMDFKEQTSKLARFFSSHLNTLGNRTRSYEDWVIDMVVYQKFWQDSPLFSIEEAINCTKNEFVFCGSSPTFNTDWRWYKAVTNSQDINSHVIENYKKSMHNLLDYRSLTSERSIEDNQKLSQITRDMHRYLKEYTKDHDSNMLNQAIESMVQLEKETDSFSPLTSKAIKDYVAKIKNHATLDFNTVFPDFQSWWGRATHYLVLEKLDN